MNLTTVGSLELKNTEVRETIQSARFMGNKAYIVTFEQKDPFFVLDMSNPTAPKVAGILGFQATVATCTPTMRIM